MRGARQVGAAVAMATLLCGCLHETYTAGLPSVRPEGPAANALYGMQLSNEARVKLGYMSEIDEARAQLGWMLAYQVNGHFSGYSDAEKVFASSSRAYGLNCRDDRDTRTKITYPGGGGFWAMPVHSRLTPCPETYKGWPHPAEFAGAGRLELVAAARALGMICSEQTAGSVCRIETSFVAAEDAKSLTRRATVNIDATGQIQVTLEGFEAAL